MASAQENPVRIENKPSRPSVLCARIFAWAVAVAAFLNVLYFVLRTSNPVMRSDAWYFFEVFIRKSLDGSLGIADFFVKRAGADHAQPLSKLLLLGELRFFDLDFAIESVIGVIAAAGCAAILHHLVMFSRRDNRTDIGRYLAWAAMCVLLFSLNAPGNWTWPLVAMGYLIVIPTLLFMWAVWHAWQRQRYLALIAATLLLGIVGDDSALIAVAVLIAAILLVLFCDPRQRRLEIWKIFATIIVCMVLVRIGYTHAPLVGGAPQAPLSASLAALLSRGHVGDAWKWISLPLTLSVAPANPFYGISVSTWSALEVVVTVLLLVAHGLFWWRALRGNYNLPMFIATCLMLLSYAWLAGILVYRVSYYGSNYLLQERYVQLYQFNLIALLLMWTGATDLPKSSHPWQYRLKNWIPAIGCVLLLALQIPLSHDAWHSRRYLLPYYRQMAIQIGKLAQDPTQTAGCQPELSICKYPLNDRRMLVQLLSTHHLNVFSPRVQQWHPFLPQWQQLSGTEAATTR